jgi:hypothetical protein
MSERMRVSVVLTSLLSGACLLGTSPFPGPGSGTSTTTGGVDAGDHEASAPAPEGGSGSGRYDSGMSAPEGGSGGGSGSGGYDSGYVPPPQCRTDGECGGQQGCRAWACVGGACQRNDPAAGMPIVPQPAGVACKRAVCDGHGNTTEVIDANVVGADAPHDCMKPTCAADGTPTLVPDPSDLPLDTPHDCLKPACAADGTPTTAPDPSDVPADQPADCRVNTCDANGNPTTVPDNADPPPPGVCNTYTCSSGNAVASPANAGKVCSSNGFACDTQGQCDVCPAVDSACTDSGPGAPAHSPQTAVDYGGLGYCDYWGRSWCGALTANESSWFTYRDDGTAGFLCVFDPYFEVKPTAPVTLCAYFDCATAVSCPVGSLPATSATGHAGCCAAAPPSTFTGMHINFCNGARIEIEVRNGASACAGYQLDFHD